MKKPLLIHLEEVTSTSSYLRNLSDVKSLPDGTAVYADFQSAGRGQKGASWESAKGENLVFSTVLSPKGLKAGHSFILSQMISLAIKDVMDTYTADISIKWPNDIYWKEKKIAGILIENDMIGDEISRSILGIGINLNQEIFKSNAPNPVSLKQITGNSYNTEDILKQIIERMLYYYLASDSAEAIKIRYKQSLFRKEGLHLFSNGIASFLARIENIEDSGLLVLKLESGEIRKFAFKEIGYIL